MHVMKRDGVRLGSPSDDGLFSLAVAVSAPEEEESIPERMAMPSVPSDRQF